jgi:hypothetical protein
MIEPAYVRSGWAPSARESVFEKVAEAAGITVREVPAIRRSVKGSGPATWTPHPALHRDPVDPSAPRSQLDSRLDTVRYLYGVQGNRGEQDRDGTTDHEEQAEPPTG